MSIFIKISVRVCFHCLKVFLRLINSVKITSITSVSLHLLAEATRKVNEIIGGSCYRVGNKKHVVCLHCNTSDIYTLFISFT